MCHALTVHPTMGSVAHQAARVPLAEKPLVVLRWMLQPRWRYDEAKRTFAPFDRIAAPDPHSGRAIVDVLAGAVERGQPALVIVNHKADSRAPRSVERLATSLRARLRHGAGSARK